MLQFRERPGSKYDLIDVRLQRNRGIDLVNIDPDFPLQLNYRFDGMSKVADQRLW